MTELAAEQVGPPDAPRVVWFLHGILGQGRNWRSFARRLVDAVPGTRAVLPDLRGHGASAALAPPHDLAAVSDDLDALSRRDGAPELVVGHSFGGKVALRWARDHGGAARIWSLDSPPGAGAVRTAGPTDPGVLVQLLRDIPTPAADRDTLRAPLRTAGVPEPIIAWLSTSARHDPDGWRWMWDLDAVEQLLRSYVIEDLWDFATASPRVHLVRAGRSDRWTAGDLERLDRLGDRAHTVPDPGHWLHVDAPEATFALIRGAMGGR